MGERNLDGTVSVKATINKYGQKATRSVIKVRIQRSNLSDEKCEISFIFVQRMLLYC